MDIKAARRHPSLRVVGVGASAGGLVALKALLQGVPPRSGLAFVIVQHLDPSHEAMLVELLQAATPMPVREAVQDMPVQPDGVYVVPPNRELTLAQGVLKLALPSQPRGLGLGIDILLASLARDLGERAAGIVLSGMGSDGTLGLQAIKMQGGLTLVQEPESAAFDAMPRSAITAGAADIVCPPEAMGLRLLELQATPPSGEPGLRDAAALDEVIALLRQQCGRDLSQYKFSTLNRRVARRMAVHGLPGLPAYAEFVRHNPQELSLLFQEMLIGVTSFFRDPAVWQELQDMVLPLLLAQPATAGPMRAWVAGCSTGEEAYSLAMAFSETAVAPSGGQARALQIFASDVNAEAIAMARRGRYPAAAVAELSPERRARFFRSEGDAVVVEKSIREMVLFAQHDVILDPPFTRLDLLSCRNLLIYFDARLQRRLLPLFAYSLRPGGALLLGSSETVGSARGLFEPASARSRLFWRSARPVPGSAMEFPMPKRTPSDAAHLTMHLTNPALDTPLQPLVSQLLIDEFSPPAVLVNAQGDILYISGSTGRYLEPASGKANWNLHVMARPGLRAQLAAALRQVFLDGLPLTTPALRLREDDRELVVLNIKRVKDASIAQPLALVIFQDQPMARKRRRSTGAQPDDAGAAELARLQDEVRALRQEMVASGEELQATNEELQATNEELQSANEELTTSKEEAQSMNEELQTLNSELQSKLDDLALAQSDMQNLLNSTDIATLFLDGALNVRRYTEQVTRLIHLRPGDIGRPLTDLATTLVYPQLEDDAREVLRSLNFVEKQVTTQNGQWYQVRIKPYRTLANMIQGVVITLIDITTAKELEARLRSG
ncbi:chemotaxis protein CheB [Leptothrix discophora]|uniref:protein-glutamate O-methyltransferase n=1 Tax=Leptothrix discophora TaxID=89 RepID=A0ABT9FXX9_LEPDI|nr:chemotaxis protein CheB [Leptothrix discophora]MDP4299010.1 chemotaxis protein CheB [Leptothrix discophora]